MTVNLQWIADQLPVRSAANVSQQFRHGPHPARAIPKTLKTWASLP
jgi:muramidase (phage lysozyme)